MKTLRRIAARLGGAFSRQESIADEMAAHLDIATDEYIRRGLSPDAARRQARLDAGSLDAAAEAYRDQRSVPVLEVARRDLGFAFKGLLRNRRYGAGIIASLAIGIGLNTSIFTVVDNVLRRPLPFADADRLVTAGTIMLGEPDQTADYLQFGLSLDAWRKARTIDVAVFAPSHRVIFGAGAPEFLAGATATPNLPRVLGVRPALGRWFGEGEERSPVVVISDATWRHQFAGDSAVVGRELRMNGIVYSVIGVMPRDVALPLDADYWIPMTEAGGQIVGRMHDGISVEAVDAELTALAPRVAALKREGRTMDVIVSPLHDHLFGSARPALTLLLGAAGLLLLITCANVTNLSLARALHRRREFAMRIALGASRASISALLVLENLLLAVGGAAIGLLLALATTGLLVSLAPPSVTLAGDFHVSRSEVLFAATLAAFACLLVSLAPVIGTSRSSLLAGGDTRNQAERSRATRRVRQCLVVTQLALTLLLLTGAGLLIRSVGRLTRPDHLGFSPAGVVVLNVSPYGDRYRDRAVALTFARDLALRLREIPGVQLVASGAPPLVAGAGEKGYREGFNTIFSWSGDEKPASGTRMSRSTGTSELIFVKNVDAAYRQAFGIRMSAGRWISDADDSTSAPVALLNKAAAKVFFGDQNPVGRLLEVPVLSRARGAPMVVGVVDDVLQRDVSLSSNPEVFLPVAQQPPIRAAVLAVKSAAPAAATIAAIQAALRQIDPSLAASRLESMESVVDASLARYTFVQRLLTLFAVVGVALAVIGLYAIVSYLVAQRATEIGVRIALGARRHHVFRIVVGEAAVLAGIGIMVGLPLTLALTRLLSSFLFEVKANDLAAFASGPVILAVVALASSWIPARHAAHLDPAKTLRQD